MIKKIGLAVVGVALLASPFAASADTVGDIQARIQTLLAQVAALQQQIAALTSNPSIPGGVVCTADAKQCSDGSYVGRTGPRCEFAACPNETTPVRRCPIISRYLSFGTRGDDVASLQTFLGMSPTGYFGSMTANAVARFQAEEGIPQLGMVGTQTRAAFARRCGNSYPQSNIFSATPTSGAAPLSVTFSSSQALSPEGPTFTVDFGDGQTANMVPGNYEGLKTTHTYQNAGSYTAQLRKTSGCMIPNCVPMPSAVVAAVSIMVTSSSTGAPSISGIDGPTTLQINQQGTWNVRVNNASNYLSYSVRWGDESGMQPVAGFAESAAVSSSGSFTHTYSRAGTYTPTFTVRDANGQSSSASASVVVGGTSANQTLTATPTAGAAPLAVNFRFVPSNDSSTTYYVNFGDGDGQAMDRQQIYCFTTPCISPSTASHTYTAAGTYIATVTPYVRCMYDLETRCMMAQAAPLASVTVTVTGGQTSTGVFSGTPISGSAPLRVHFATNNMTQSPPTIRDWYSVDFGDGTNAELALSGCSGSIGCVDHTYTQAGTYTARIVHHPDPAATCPANTGTFCGSTLNFNTVTITVTGTSASFEKPFTDAGCSAYPRDSEGQTTYNCQNASSVKAFGCTPGGEVLGSEFNIPMMRCSYMMNDSSRTPSTDYFNCGGGMLWSCNSYVAYINGSFQIIKNAPALMSRIGTIQNEAQALRYVLMTQLYTKEKVSFSNGYTLPSVGVMRSNDRFLVTVYRPQNVFGCYSDNPYEKVVFEVTSSGVVSETQRAVVYTETRGGAICVD